MRNTPLDDVASCINLNQPNAARMQDYFLGGNHNFRTDRDTAEALLAVAPHIAVAARASRAFLHRAVDLALTDGVRQFLDLGCGIQTLNAVHQIAHRSDPTATVVYVDNDPIVVAHTATRSHCQPHVGVLKADIRHIEAILDHRDVCRLLDFTQPVAVLMVDILHFIPGDCITLLHTLRRALAPASLLVISHASTIAPTEQTQAMLDVYRRTATPVHLRTPEEIHALFAGLDLLHPDPGSLDPPQPVPVTRWRPDPDQAPVSADAATNPFVNGVLGGVGRKTPPTTHPSEPAPTTTHQPSPPRVRPPGARPLPFGTGRTVRPHTTAAALTAEYPARWRGRTGITSGLGRVPVPFGHRAGATVRWRRSFGRPDNG